VEWAREKAGNLTALRVGTVDQRVLGSSGDDHRIDWGYAYAAALSSQANAVIGADQTLVNAFVAGSGLPSEDDQRMPRAVNDDQPVMAFVFDLGNVSGAPVTRQVIVAYDEIYAIKYLAGSCGLTGGAMAKPLRKCCEKPRGIIQKLARRLR